MVSLIPKERANSATVDRLRDLARRSFLARLCLASGDEPLWKLERSKQVDVALSEESERGRWRATWRGTLESLGAPSAADPAVRAVDPIREPIAGPG